MTPAEGRPIFLVGFMGSGKSTIGRRLAGELGWAFIDTDDRIEKQEGKAVQAIFSESGESHFRRIEARVIAEVSQPERVIAVGGGAFLGARNRRRMQQSGCVLWLDVPLERVRERLGRGDGRPLWDPSDPLSQRILYERRRAVYALAGRRIAVADDPPETLAQRILREIQ